MFTDARLQQLWSMLETDAVQALTLDVFDTLLWRTVPEPAGVFRLLGERLDREGLLVAGITPASFTRLRVSAEEAARQRSLHQRATEECRLAEVYGLLAGALRMPQEASRLMALEVEVERDVVRGDLGVIELADRVVRELGKPVHLVSDTYFSSGQLRRLLTRPELSCLELAGVHSSSDLGRNKSGGLFDIVLAEQGVPAARTVHLGDNPVSDVEAATEAGMSSVLYAKYNPELQRVLTAEGVLPGSGRPVTELDPVHGDFGLTAVRAKAVHRSEGAAVPAGLQLHWQTGAAVFGPAFTGFAEWVATRCQELGVPTIRCLMREGEFLARLIADPADRAGLDVRTMWASRQVVALASILDGTVDELGAFLLRRQAPTVAQLAGQLGFDVTEVPSLLDLADVQLVEPGITHRTLTAISSTPEVRGGIVLRATRARERLLAYVSDLLPESGRVAIVDLGWGGTIQALLQKMLSATGRQVELVGLYLATNDGALDHRLRGMHIEGYLADGGEPERLFAPVMRSPEVLEQVCMPDVGSLIGFDAQQQPVTSSTRMPRTQVAQTAAAQRGVLAFQREWSRYRRSPAQLPPLDGRQAREQLLRMLWRFTARPTPNEAIEFGVWAHDENFGSDATEGLVSDEMVRVLPYLTPVELAQFSMREMYWPAAVAMLLNPALASLAGLVAEGTASADSLSPTSGMGDIEVYVDAGEDFINGPTEAVAPRSIRDALSFVRVRIDARGVRRVRIDPGGRRGLVRIDWIRLVFALHSREEPYVVELTDLHHPRLVIEGGRLLQRNLLEVTGGDPQLVYRLDPATEGIVTSNAYLLDVELAFSSLSLVDEPLALPAPPAARPARQLAGRAARRLVRELRSMQA